MISKLNKAEIKKIIDLIEDLVINDYLLLEIRSSGFTLKIKSLNTETFQKDSDIKESTLIKNISDIFVIINLFYSLKFNFNTFLEEFKEFEINEDLLNKLKFLNKEISQRKNILKFFIESSIGWGYKITDIDYITEMRTIYIDKGTIFIPLAHISLNLFDLHESSEKIIKIHLTKKRIRELIEILNNFEDEITQNEKKIDEIEKFFNK